MEKVMVMSRQFVGYISPLLVLYALHFKSLPLSYTLRSYLLVRSVFSRAKQYILEPLDLFTIVNQHERCWWDDLDYNSHMTNSSFNKLLDFSRIRILYYLFPQIMLDPHIGILCSNAGVVTMFKKEILVLQRYTIQSRIFCWDEKWLFVEHRFVVPKARSSDDQASVSSTHHRDYDVACIALSTLVFKQRMNGETVSPIKVFELCGHPISQQDEARCAANARKAGDVVQLRSMFQERASWGQPQWLELDLIPGEKAKL